RIRVALKNRLAGVAALGDPRVDRNLTQEWDSAVIRQFLTAAVAKDLVPLTVVAHKVTHVLDGAKDRHAHFPEHVERLASVNQAHILWGRDNDGTGNHDGLTEA